MRGVSRRNARRRAPRRGGEAAFLLALSVPRSAPLRAWTRPRRCRLEVCRELEAQGRLAGVVRDEGPVRDRSESSLTCSGSGGDPARL